MVGDAIAGQIQLRYRSICGQHMGEILGASIRDAATFQRERSERVVRALGERMSESLDAVVVDDSLGNVQGLQDMIFEQRLRENLYGSRGHVVVSAEEYLAVLLVDEVLNEDLHVLVGVVFTVESGWCSCLVQGDVLLKLGIRASLRVAVRDGMNGFWHHGRVDGCWRADREWLEQGNRRLDFSEIDVMHAVLVHFVLGDFEHRPGPE